MLCTICVTEVRRWFFTKLDRENGWPFRRVHLGYVRYSWRSKNVYASTWTLNNDFYVLHRPRTWLSVDYIMWLILISRYSKVQTGDVWHHMSLHSIYLSRVPGCNKRGSLPCKSTPGHTTKGGSLHSMNNLEGKEKKRQKDPVRWANNKVPITR